MRQGPQKALTGSALDSLVAQFGQRSMIKSIQTLIITKIGGTTSANGTITSVVPANTVVYTNGYNQSNSADAIEYSFAVQLTNATTVNVSTGGSGIEINVNITVVEYVPGVIKSKQAGAMSTIATPATTSTVTITTVNVNKAALIQAGYTATGSTSGTGSIATRFVLTNATTITAQRKDNSAGWTITPYYQIVEFY